MTPASCGGRLGLRIRLEVPLRSPRPLPPPRTRLRGLPEWGHLPAYREQRPQETNRGAAGEVATSGGALPPAPESCRCGPAPPTYHSTGDRGPRAVMRLLPPVSVTLQSQMRRRRPRVGKRPAQVTQRRGGVVMVARERSRSSLEIWTPQAAPTHRPAAGSRGQFGEHDPEVRRPSWEGNGAGRGGDRADGSTSRPDRTPCTCPSRV